MNKTIRARSRELSCGLGLSLLVLSLPSAVRAQTSIVVNRVYQVDATGTTIQNCDRLRALLATLSGLGGASRAVVKLEPGEYNCQANTVPIPSYVTVEGSGPSSVFILGNLDSDDTGIIDFDGVVDSALRGVSLFHYGIEGSGIGVTVTNSAVELEYVRINVNGPSYAVGMDARSDAQTSVRIRDSAVLADTVAIVAAKAAGAAFTAVDVLAGELSEPTVSVTGGASVRCGASVSIVSYAQLDAACAPPTP